MAQSPFRWGLLTGAALLALAPQLAFANETYTVAFGPANGGSFGGGTGTIAVNLPAFNTLTDGSLTGIVLTLTTTGSDQFQATNTSGTPYTFSAGHVNGSVSLTYAPDLTLSVANILVSTGFAGTALANQSTFFSGSALHSTASTTILPANFAAYEDTSLTPLVFDVTFGGFTAGGAKQTGAGTALTFGGTGTLSGTVTITYATVPEPASLTLVGGALVGMGVIRRRKKNSAV